MSNMIQVGSTVQTASGARGKVVAVDPSSGRIAIRWASSGNLLTYTPADVQSRFKLGIGADSVTMVRERNGQPAKRASRCPNPGDCGDPTCDGGCGY